MDRCVHDAQRITDSATATSRCSRSPAPMVWFLLLLMPMARDGFALVALRASAVPGAEEEAITTTASQGTFSPDADGSGSLDSCAQKKEKLGIDAMGDGKTTLLGSQTPPNENPEVAQEGALSATNAEKEDLQANVGEHTSSDRLWQAIGPPVLKLTSRLRDASGVEKEHGPGSSLLRLISWQ